MAKFVYMANKGSNNVVGCHIDRETGALKEVPSSPFPTEASPESIAIRVVPKR